MAIKTIMVYPRDEQQLRQKSEAIACITPDVREQIRDLKDTLKASDDGVGLAAPQINIHTQIVIVCLGTDIGNEWKAGPPRALINPRVILAQDVKKDFDGCLSFPGLYGETKRPHRLRVVGKNEDGSLFDEILEGFNAVLVHHEIDHLQGILFIDRVETPDDLYMLQKNENGQWCRQPIRSIAEWEERKEDQS